MSIKGGEVTENRFWNFPNGYLRNVFSKTLCYFYWFSSFPTKCGGFICVPFLQLLTYIEETERKLKPDKFRVVSMKPGLCGFSRL